jgi:LPPG:FO 2-phospho-L-lactate transferase
VTRSAQRPMPSTSGGAPAVAVRPRGKGGSGRAGVKVVVPAGGVGGARFLRGLLAALDERPGDHEVTVIGNTADDITLFGLRVCPDLDTVMYTLGEGVHEGQGWGRAEETFTVKEELAAYDVEPQWFGLGDRDIATHIVRTQMLAAGYPLSAVTEALCARWLSRRAPGVRLLPMSDDRIETHVVLADEEAPGGRRAVHFQEWWVRLHASVPAQQIVAIGIEEARPAPGVLESIAAADLVLLPPSNPVVSLGTILGVPGIRQAIARATAPVLGISPIIGGAPVRGMADACLSAIGVETTATAVGKLFADLLDGWLVDDVDAGAAVDGVEVRAVPLLMRDVAATSAIARSALDLADDLLGRTSP